MKKIMDNWEDFFSEVADSIATLSSFRQSHVHMDGVFRHPAADAYAYTALLTVAEIQARTDSGEDMRPHITLTINNANPDATARTIIELIINYRRRHGGQNPSG